QMWTATYTIVAGSIDASNRNVSVSVNYQAGTTKTVADTTNAKVDNIAPTLTDARISISGATGSAGTFKIGDTVTATWNSTAGGDNHASTELATSTPVRMYFSQFGGTPVVATNNAQTWTASYTIVAGSLTAFNRNVYVLVRDNAGNITITGDTTNA